MDRAHGLDVFARTEKRTRSHRGDVLHSLLRMQPVAQDAVNRCDAVDAADVCSAYTLYQQSTH